CQVVTLPADADAASLSPLRKLSGTVIDGRYEVGELLGHGGMGAVYEAMQLELDRKVAIKILNPAFMHRDDYLARFMQEAKAASRIRHENVVQMLDFGKLPNGSVYSVMELLHGQDLSRHLKQVGKLPWSRARDLLLQLVRGVKAAHAQGVIHRDIKPANLFLTRDGAEGREVLKVLDFGVARVQSSADGETAALTGTADLLGTPAYMAPELARGKRACARTEVYSVGIVAFQVLCGRVPFRGDSPFDALFRAATEPTPPLRSFEPSVPEVVEAMVMRALAKNPDDRYADMGELLTAIHAIDEHGRSQFGPAVATTGPHPSLADVTVIAPPPAMPTPAPTPHTMITPALTPSQPFVAPPPQFFAQQSSPSLHSTTQVGRRRGPVLALLAVGGIAVAIAIGIAMMRPAPTTPVADARPIEAATVPAPIAPAPAPVVQPPAPAPEPEPADAGIELVVEDEVEPARTDAPPEKIARPPTSKPAPPKVEEPPTDAQVLRKLQRQAKSRCGALVGTEPLRVTFGIGQRGEVIAPRGDRRGAATDCVIDVLDGARFPAGSMRREVLTL
ncbi:MAG TPA: serine/threonine-protein kinase, partial [Nannocystaceae bacterium]|nr:serine/threonine-protein kinase [Nannocystaceae bacterium]